MLLSNLFYSKLQPNLPRDGAGSGSGSQVNPENLGRVVPGARQAADGLLGVGEAQRNPGAAAAPHDSGQAAQEAGFRADAAAADEANRQEVNAAARRPFAATTGPANPAPTPPGNNGDGNKNNSAADQNKNDKDKDKDRPNQYPGAEYWLGALYEMMQNDDIQNFSKKFVGTPTYAALDFACKKMSEGKADWMEVQQKMDQHVSQIFSSMPGKVKDGAVNAYNAVRKKMGGNAQQSEEAHADDTLDRPDDSVPLMPAADIARRAAEQAADERGLGGDDAQALAPDAEGDGDGPRNGGGRRLG